MKQTILDIVDELAGGVIQIRMRKQTVENGIVTENGFHRTILNPGDDIDAQFANVNASLEYLGFGPISAKEIAQLKAFAKDVWKPNKKTKGE